MMRAGLEYIHEHLDQIENTCAGLATAHSPIMKEGESSS